MKDSMKKMPFYVIRYSDSRHRFQGLYYDLPTESPPLEFQYQDTFAFGNPRNPNQKGSLEAINEILWEEYLPYCLDSYQLIDNKKAILKALGFEKRRLPNGWIGIYDVRRHFRIVLIGLQVQNRHHTEYYQILTSLEQKGAEIHMRTIQNMKNLPTSAALTNKISMELIGESYEEIFGGYINDLTVVTAQRNPNSVEYEF
jgi:hypothetical protein